MTETYYQRIAREQRERRERRKAGFSDKTIARQQARVRASARRARRYQDAAEIEAEYMPDSFDPPERPEF